MFDYPDSIAHSVKSRRIVVNYAPSALLCYSLLFSFVKSIFWCFSSIYFCAKPDFVSFCLNMSYYIQLVTTTVRKIRSRQGLNAINLGVLQVIILLLLHVTTAAVNKEGSFLFTVCNVFPCSCHFLQLRFRTVPTSL